MSITGTLSFTYFPADSKSGPQFFLAMPLIDPGANVVDFLIPYTDGNGVIDASISSNGNTCSSISSR